MTYRLTAWNDLSIELVHGHQSQGVRVKVDESIGGRFASELVLDHLLNEIISIFQK